MNKLSVYTQMTSNPNTLFEVMKREIGVKCNCLPFALKSIDALKSLGKLNENEANKAAFTFLDNWQTLTQGGITAEDYDKTDFVKRGKVITISARVEAFMRAAARKGYRITETIVAVPKDDSNTTYFKENFYNGEIVYTLEDRRIQGDREIKSQRLIDGYFTKFLCRLEVTEIKTNKRLVMTVCEMSLQEVMNAVNASDNGIFKTRWENYTDNWGNSKKRKVLTNEINHGSIWNVWTAAMVEKTVIRRALKRIREVLPELKDTIYAFDRDSDNVDDFVQETEKVIDIPLESVNVDLNNLTESQQAEVAEMFELFKANPKLAQDKANEIMAMFFEGGKSAEELINTHYASIVNIKGSPRLSPIIQPLFETPQAKPQSGALCCAECGKEIKSEKSIKYYADNPDKTVKCYTCNKGG